jgi:ribose/xylose/arabinose/galactoside ABC-type transport system permease subunit
MSNPGAPMPWWQIIAITAAAAVVVGVCLGVLTSVANLPTGWATLGVGATTGAVGAFLINRRRNGG